MTVVDLAVVGAGPAGLACAETARELGVDVVLIESTALGGQLVNVAALEDVEDVDVATGWDLAAELTDRAYDAGATIVLAEVAEATRKPESWHLAGAGLSVQARTLVLATGTVAAPLPIEDSDRYVGIGLSTCAACDGQLFAGRAVAVVGGADLARWEVAHLAPLAARVVLLAPSTVRWAVPAGVEVVEGASLQTLEGATSIEQVVYTDATGLEHTLAVDAVFNALGRRPSVPNVAGIETDTTGAIIVEDGLATTAAGCLAAGDVRAGAPGRIAAALADGRRAATIAATAATT